MRLNFYRLRVIQKVAKLKANRKYTQIITIDAAAHPLTTRKKKESPLYHFEMSESNYDDPFKMLRNNFNFTFICEFLHNFSSAFFNGPDDVLPTTPVFSNIRNTYLSCLCFSTWSICYFIKMMPRRLINFI